MNYIAQTLVIFSVFAFNLSAFGAESCQLTIGKKPHPNGGAFQIIPAVQVATVEECVNKAKLYLNVRFKCVDMIGWPTVCRSNLVKFKFQDGGHQIDGVITKSL